MDNSLIEASRWIGRKGGVVVVVAAEHGECRSQVSLCGRTVVSVREGDRERFY